MLKGLKTQLINYNCALSIAKKIRDDVPWTSYCHLFMVKAILWEALYILSPNRRSTHTTGATSHEKSTRFAHLLYIDEVVWVCFGVIIMLYMVNSFSFTRSLTFYTEDGLETIYLSLKFARCFSGQNKKPIFCFIL